MDSDNVLVDFDRKHLHHNVQRKFVDDEVEITDEFGRTRRVPASLARSMVGLEVNLETDYKEYDERDTGGYHMVSYLCFD